MSDRYLKGNGRWCEACAGTGKGKLSSTMIYSDGSELDLYARCEACAGQRRIALPEAEIIAATVETHLRNIDSMEA